jgi:hypothetical protein
LTHRECQITVLRSTSTSSTKQSSPSPFLHGRAGHRSGSPHLATRNEAAVGRFGEMYRAVELLTPALQRSRASRMAHPIPSSPLSHSHRGGPVYQPLAVDFWNNLAASRIPTVRNKRLCQNQTKPNHSRWCLFCHESPTPICERSGNEEASPSPAGTESSMRSAVSSGARTGKSSSDRDSAHGTPGGVSNTRWTRVESGSRFARFSVLQSLLSSCAGGKRMARSEIV